MPGRAPRSVSGERAEAKRTGPTRLGSGGPVTEAGHLAATNPERALRTDRSW